MLVLNSYNMLPISRLRRTHYLCSLGGSSAHLLDETTSVVTSANPSPFFQRKPLWNDLDFVPCRVKPRSTCSSYPNRSPPPNFTIGLPEGFQNYTSKTYLSRAFSYPRKYFAQLQTFQLTLPMLMINIREIVTLRQFCDRKSTTRTITLRVAQATSTLATQPSL